MVKKITASIIILLVLCQSSISAKTIKAGIMESTPVSIVAEWPIGKDTQIGEHFSARIVEDIVSDSGEIHIPKNSRVIGTITKMDNAKSFHRNGRVDIKFEKIIFPDNITTIEINADGDLIRHNGKKLKMAKEGLKNTAGGALMGAFLGLRFGGILGTGTSTASNLAIGAVTGASVSLISFIGKKGKEVEINPGLPMILNITNMEKQNYVAQNLGFPEKKRVEAEIISVKDNEIDISIDNQLTKDIPLTNIKIIDGLGYTIKPNLALNYHDIKAIPAMTSTSYKLKFSPTTKDARYWIVLTDSFNKQEYFREELSY